MYRTPRFILNSLVTMARPATARPTPKSGSGSGLGNCGEHSVLAWLHFNRSGIHPVELIKINSEYELNFTHAFVVLNRSPDSDLGDPKTWGSDCVVFDPWLRAIFTADNYGKMRIAWPQLYKPDDIVCVISNREQVG